MLYPDSSSPAPVVAIALAAVLAAWVLARAPAQNPVRAVVSSSLAASTSGAERGHLGPVSRPEIVNEVAADVRARAAGRPS